MKILLVLLFAILSIGSINYEFTPGENHNDLVIIDLMNEDYEYFTGTEELIYDVDLEVGDIIAFEIYPQANAKGYQFVLIYEGIDEELNYQYARYFREIDGNWIYCEFDVEIKGSSITFTNSIFVIEDETEWWTSRNLPTIYNIPTYLRGLVVYKKIN